MRLQVCGDQLGCHKLLELESKNIDCIWNGMTITPELQEAISISDPYIKNYQVVVIRAADADKYTSTESLAGANLDAEAGCRRWGGSGSADRFPQPASYTSVVKQTDALLEVQERRGGRGGDGFRSARRPGRHRVMVIPPIWSCPGGRRLPPGLLTAAVNQAMQELIGTLNELTVK